MSREQPPTLCIHGVCPRDPHDECQSHCHQRYVEMVEDWHGKAQGGYDW